MRQPMQPLGVTLDGVIRFQENSIVAALLDAAKTGRKMDMNDIARRNFSQEDRCQFAQLIGYSLSGYHELSYVSDEHATEATEAARKVLPLAAGCRDVGCEMHCGVKRAE